MLLAWLTSLAWLLLESIAIYCALPWLMVPGIVLDVPLRMLLWLQLDASELGLWAAVPAPLRWTLILCARCATVHALSPLLSPMVAEILEPAAKASAAPYVVSLRSIRARPFHGACDVEMEINAQQILRDMGYDYTALRFTRVVAGLSIYATPFAPLWRCGFHSLQVVATGELASDASVSQLQRVELVLRGQVMVHSWGVVRMFAPYLPALPSWLAPPLFQFESGILELTTTAATSSAQEAAHIVQLAMGPASMCVASASGPYSLSIFPFVDVASLELGLGGIVCTVGSTAASLLTKETVMWTGGDVVHDSLAGPNFDTGLVPLCKFDVQFRRGATLRIKGGVGCLWLRTHFKALKMLLAVITPEPVSPFPQAAFDIRLREIHAAVRASHKEAVSPGLIAAVNSDQILRERIRIAQEHGATCVEPEVAIASMQRQSSETGTAFGMPALYMSFQSIEDRLLLSMATMRRPDGRVPIRAVGKALQNDTFLRYLIDYSAYNTLPSGSWCDKLLCGLPPCWKGLHVRTDMVECTYEQAQMILIGETEVTDTKFTVQIRRRTDGIQKFVQNYVGGPVVATVEARCSQTVEELRQQVAAKAGLLLEGMRLYTETEDWLDDTDKDLATIFFKNLKLWDFPKTLLIVEGFTLDFRSRLQRALQCRIDLAIDVSFHIGACVVSDNFLRRESIAAAEIVCDFGRGRLQCLPLADTVSEATLLDTLTEQQLAGTLYDSDGWLQTTFDIEIENGCHVYVLATSQGLIDHLDVDGNGEITIDELQESLRSHGLSSESLSEADIDGDGLISPAELSRWLDIRPDVVELLCHSTIFHPIRMDMSIGQSFLPSGSLGNFALRNVPRSKADISVSPIELTIDMRDIDTIMLLANAVSQAADGLMAGIADNADAAAVYYARLGVFHDLGNLTVEQRSWHALTSRTVYITNITGDYCNERRLEAALAMFGKISVMKIRHKDDQPSWALVTFATTGAYNSALAPEGAHRALALHGIIITTLNIAKAKTSTGAFGKIFQASQKAILDAEIAQRAAHGPAIPKDVTEWQILLTERGHKVGGSRTKSWVSFTARVARANVPMLMLNAKLCAETLQQRRGIMTAQAQLQLSGAYENEESNSWEYWLEPWACSIFSEQSSIGESSPFHDMDAQDGSSNPSSQKRIGQCGMQRLEITALAPSTINLTYGFLRMGLEISNQLRSVSEQSDRISFRRADLAFSPFILRNNTGLAVDFVICNGKSAPPLAHSDLSRLESGSYAWLPIEMMKSSYISESRRNAVLHFRVSGHSSFMCSVQMREVGVQLVTHDQIKGLQCHIEIDDVGRKAITLRSQIQLHNQLSVDLRCQIGTQSSFLLCAGRQWSVPLTMYEGSLRLRPNISAAHAEVWSSPVNLGSSREPDSGVKVVPKPGELIPIRVRLSDGSLFHCHASWRKEQFGAISFQTLALVPFLTIVNRLPFAARISLLPSADDAGSRTDLRGTDLGWCLSGDDVTLAEQYLRDRQHEIPAFAKLSVDDIRKVAAGMGIKEYEVGATIIKNGQPGRSFFMIKSGTVGFSSKDDDTIASTRESGEFFGEIALLNEDTLCTATAIAQTECMCYTISRNQFDTRLRNSMVATTASQQGDNSDAVSITIEPGESFSLPSIGRWSEHVGVDCAVTAIDLLFPPTRARLRELYVEMDIDFDGRLTLSEILNLWERDSKLRNVLNQLVAHNYLEEEETGSPSSANQDDLLKKQRKQIVTFFKQAGQNCDDGLDLTSFIDAFRFPSVANNQALETMPIYHEGLVSTGTTTGTSVPPVLTAAWRQSNPALGIPIVVPIVRDKRSEGVLAMRYEFSTQGAESTQVHLYCSHWLVNNSNLPLVATARVGIDEDKGLGHELSVVEDFTKSLVGSVHDIFTGTLKEVKDGAQKSNLQAGFGLVRGISKGIVGVVDNSIGASLKLTKDVLTTTLDRGMDVVKLTDNIAQRSIKLADKGIKSTRDIVTGRSTRSLSTAPRGSLRVSMLRFKEGNPGSVQENVRILLRLKGRTNQVRSKLLDWTEGFVIKNCETHNLQVDEGEPLVLTVAVVAESLGDDDDLKAEIIGCTCVDLSTIRCVGRRPLKRWISVQDTTRSLQGPDMGDRIPITAEVQLEVQWTVGGNAGPIKLAPGFTGGSSLSSEDVAQTVDVRGYSLFGVGEDAEIQLQLRLPDAGVDRTKQNTAPIGVCTYDVSVVTDEQKLALKLPAAYGSVRKQLKVTVTPADLQYFDRSKIVEISNPWTVVNRSSHRLVVRTSAQTYEVLRDTATIDISFGESPLAGPTLRQGEMIDAVGLDKRGVDDREAICFVDPQTGNAYWVPLANNAGIPLLRRRRRVIGRFKVTTTKKVPVFLSYTVNRTTTGQNLHHGETVDVFEIKEGKGEESYLGCIEETECGAGHWVKIGKRGEQYLEEVHELPPQQPSTRQKQSSSKLGEHDEVEWQPNTLNLQQRQQYLLPGEEHPLDCWRSDTFDLQLHISVADNNSVRDGELVWASAVSLPAVPRPPLLFEVPQHNGDVRFVSGHIPTAGVIVLRNAVSPRYAILNEVCYSFEFLPRPSERCWWSTAPAFMKTSVWGVLPLNSNGQIDIESQDKRKYANVSLSLRVPGRLAGTADSSQIFECPFENGDWSWDVYGERVRVTIAPHEDGSILATIWTQAARPVISLPQINTNIRLHGLHCSVIDRHRREVSRFVVDNLRMSIESLGLLHVTVVSAEGMESSACSYCELQLLGERRKTRTATGAKPQWFKEHEPDGQTSDFQFSIGSRHNSELQISVHSEGVLYAERIVGEARIKLQHVAFVEGGVLQTVPLTAPESNQVIGRLKLVMRFVHFPVNQPQLLEMATGAILWAGNKISDESSASPLLPSSESKGVSAAANLPPFDGVLKVTVVSCAHLLPADNNGLSDPYTKVHLGAKGKRTNVVSNTLNPVFEKTFQWNIRANQAAESLLLHVVVKDNDIGSLKGVTSNDLLGEVVLDLTQEFAGGWMAELNIERPLGVSPKRKLNRLTVKQLNSRKRQGDSTPYGTVRLCLIFGRSAASRTPDHTFWELPKGVHLAQKWTGATRLETAALQCSLQEMNCNLETVIIRQLSDFHASLLPQMIPVQSVQHIQSVLCMSASRDRALVPTYIVNGQDIQCSGPETLNLKTTKIKMSVNLHDYLDTLPKDTSAHALAKYYAFDLDYFLLGSTMALVREIVGQFANVDLKAHLDPMLLPKHGNILTSQESSTEMWNYIYNQLCILGLKMIPNPGRFLKNSHKRFSKMVGSAVDKKEPPVFSLRASSLGNPRSSIFTRGPKVYGPAGELLPWEELSNDAPQLFKVAPYALLLISTRCELHSVVAEAARPGVVPVLFDGSWELPSEVLRHTKAKLLDYPFRDTEATAGTLQQIAIMTSVAPSESALDVAAICEKNAHAVKFKFTCTVVECDNLIKGDHWGGNDVYATIAVDCGREATQGYTLTRRIRTIQGGGAAPCWGDGQGETVSWGLELAPQSFRVDVWDEDCSGGDDRLGAAFVPIDRQPPVSQLEATPWGAHESWYDLTLGHKGSNHKVQWNSSVRDTRKKSDTTAGRIRLRWFCYPVVDSAVPGGLAVGETTGMVPGENTRVLKEQSSALWNGLKDLLQDSGHFSLFFCEDAATRSRGHSLCPEGMARLTESASELSLFTNRHVDIIPPAQQGLTPQELTTAAAELCDPSRFALWAGSAGQAASTLRSRHNSQSSLVGSNRSLLSVGSVGSDNADTYVKMPLIYQPAAYQAHNDMQRMRRSPDTTRDTARRSKLKRSKNSGVNVCGVCGSNPARAEAKAARKARGVDSTAAFT